MSAWHGWSCGGAALHIGPLPDRKRICLFIMRGSVLHPLAYFATAEDAREALAVLDLMMGATRYAEEGARDA